VTLARPIAHADGVSVPTVLNLRDGDHAALLALMALQEGDESAFLLLCATRDDVLDTLSVAPPQDAAEEAMVHEWLEHLDDEDLERRQLEDFARVSAAVDWSAAIVEGFRHSLAPEFGGQRAHELSVELRNADGRIRLTLDDPFLGLRGWRTREVEPLRADFLDRRLTPRIR